MRRSKLVTCSILLLVAVSAAATSNAQAPEPTPIPENLSFRMTKVGDLNGDRFRDIVQLESKGNVKGFKLQSINFISGISLATLQRLEVKKLKINDPLAAASNDYNGDGKEDVAIVSRKTKLGDSDRILIFSGATGERIKAFKIRKNPDFRIHSIGGLGDLNADGIPDFAVGGVKDRPEVRSLMLVSGKNGRVIKKLSTKVSEAFAQDLTKIGDLNGDGISEILVGGASEGTTSYGAFSIHSGSDLSEISKSIGEGPLYLGDDVHAAPDLDEDGIRDFVVSDLNRTQGSGRHRFRVYSTASLRLMYIISVDGLFVRLNSRVIDFVSDIDSDCVPEIVVAGDNGVLHLFSGRTGNKITIVSLGSAASFASLSTMSKPYSYRVALSDARSSTLRIVDLQALLALQQIFVDDCEPPLWPWF